MSDAAAGPKPTCFSTDLFARVCSTSNSGWLHYAIHCLLLWHRHSTRLARTRTPAVAGPRRGSLSHRSAVLDEEPGHAIWHAAVRHGSRCVHATGQREAELRMEQSGEVVRRTAAGCGAKLPTRLLHFLRRRFHRSHTARRQRQLRLYRRRMGCVQVSEFPKRMHGGCTLGRRLRASGFRPPSDARCRRRALPSRRAGDAEQFQGGGELVPFVIWRSPGWPWRCSTCLIRKRRGCAVL